MPSFDIVSELDMQEVDNAINQARKEVEGRYDFKGSMAEIKYDKDKNEITIQAEDEYKMGAISGIIMNKAGKRGIDLKALKLEDIEPAGGRTLRQKIKLIQGLEKEVAKDVVKAIKDSKLKVQPQIMDDKVRVTSKSIDELQATMTQLKSQNFPVPLQYNNMRS